MKRIHIDFETRSEIDIRKSGAWAYAAHHSTEIICLSWAYRDGEPLIWYPGCSYDQELNELFLAIEEGWKLFAWNASFEYFIWNMVGVPKNGWPAVPKHQFIDTAAIAMSLGLPASLGLCGNILELDIQKDKRGEDLINKLSKPRRGWTELIGKWWTPDTVLEDFQAFYDYCKQDVRSERAIYHRIKEYSLSQKEQNMWLITLWLNEKGIPCDVENAKLLHTLIERYKEKLNAELAKITNDTITSGGQAQRIKKYMAERGFNLPDMTKSTVADTLNYHDLPTDLERILEIRQAIGKTSTAKIEKLLSRVDENDMLHDIMIYHRAITGRWGGSGVQIHNLPRAKIANPEIGVWVIQQQDPEIVEMLYDNVMDFAVKMIRPLLKAKPGYRFIVVDYSGIEARMVAWVVRDQDTLNRFKQGICIYRWFATRLYPVTYEQVTDAQRAHAKTCILGLGYGMGWERFLSQCLGMGLQMDEAEARRSIKLYRKVLHKVPQHWYKQYDIAMKAIRTKSEWAYDRIGFEYHDKWLFITLPSGRKVSLFDAKVELCDTPWGDQKLGITYWGEDPQTHKWVKLQSSPGKLMGIICQASARDILADAKIKLIKAGYNIVFSVHDELISHDPQDFGSLEEFSQIMCGIDKRVYAGLPIVAKGYEAERYKKD